MDLPTAWNIDDKSDRLIVDGLRVNYTGKVIGYSC